MRFVAAGLPHILWMGRPARGGPKSDARTAAGEAAEGLRQAARAAAPGHQRPQARPEADPQAPTLHVCSVNYDTCIGCMACEKWCPDDYDAIRMLPFAQVIKEREAYETATFSVDIPYE